MKRPVRTITAPRGFRARADAYYQEHAAAYAAMVRRIDPGLSVDPGLSQDRPALASQVYPRIAFAILSANVPFDNAVKALAYSASARWAPDPFILATMGQVPAKAEYLRAMVAAPAATYIRQPSTESWQAYRERLARDVKGLGRAKASFAACLLYPQDADLACLDTHMAGILWGASSFLQVSRADYEHGERWVRRYARRWGINTFLAQWVLWDCRRTGAPQSHDIFPGSHRT